MPQLKGSFSKLIRWCRFLLTGRRQPLSSQSKGLRCRSISTPLRTSARTTRASSPTSGSISRRPDSWPVRRRIRLAFSQCHYYIIPKAFRSAIRGPRRDFHSLADISYDRQPPIRCSRKTNHRLEEGDEQAGPAEEADGRCRRAGSPSGGKGSPAAEAAGGVRSPCYGWQAATRRGGDPPEWTAVHFTCELAQNR